MRVGYFVNVWISSDSVRMAVTRAAGLKSKAAEAFRRRPRAKLDVWVLARGSETKEKGGRADPPGQALELRAPVGGGKGRDRSCLGAAGKDLISYRVGFSFYCKGEFCREMFVKDVVRGICKVRFWVKVGFKVFAEMGQYQSRFEVDLIVFVKRGVRSFLEVVRGAVKVCFREVGFFDFQVRCY